MSLPDLPAVYSDPTALTLTVIAVILVGLSKGGLGGAFAMIGVPLMTLAIPPVQTAAILLPILIFMDWVSLWKWWGGWNGATLKLMLPGAIIGIGVGWLSAAVTPDAFVRLVVGLVGLFFVLQTLAAHWRRTPRPEAAHNPVKASIWGSVAGFTSFVAHAGGPPFQIYALALRLPPPTYVSTSVAFFAVVNAVKVAPYAALGQFAPENLVASAIMFPLAVVSTLAGAAIVKRIKAEVFYPFAYTMLFLVAVKLIYDGATGLLG